MNIYIFIEYLQIVGKNISCSHWIFKIAEKKCKQNMRSFQIFLNWQYKIKIYIRQFQIIDKNTCISLNIQYSIKKITKRMHNFIEKQHLLVTFLALGYYAPRNATCEYPRHLWYQISIRFNQISTVIFFCVRAYDCEPRWKRQSEVDDWTNSVQESVETDWSSLQCVNLFVMFLLSSNHLMYND